MLGAAAAKRRKLRRAKSKISIVEVEGVLRRSKAKRWHLRGGGRASDGNLR